MNLRQRKCRACRAPVWAGDSDDWAALHVEIDNSPLGPQGEALARLTGRCTFMMRRHGGGLRLQTRDHWQIAGGRRPRYSDVVAEHRCGAPLPTVPSRLLVTPTDQGATSACPF